jgi:cyclohexa-1,5-dienecarbonyl-CoA hydratase
MTAERLIRVERRGGAQWIILDRPPLNVLDISMLEELESALSVAAAADASVIVLTGAGKAFCAGVDVSDHMGERATLMLRSFHAVIERLLGLEQPVVAVVGGAALGGGCELLLACDVVIARAGTKFGQPEIRLGVFPPAAAALLPLLVGRQRALDLILTGRMIQADEAYALGLISRVLPADGFAEAAEAMVAELASLSPPVLRLAKQATSGDPAKAVTRLHSAERLYLDNLMKLADAHEGLVAFLEKRAPVWKGT